VSEETPENLELMRRIDEEYTRHPFYGTRKMRDWLQRQGYAVNRKRVQRLMRRMGLESVAPKPNTSRPAPEHKVYPYRLRGLAIERTNQVWCADITYIRLSKGFVYLTAVMDWYSRYVLAWEVSVTMESSFCVARWRAPCAVMDGRRSSTPTKACSSPARRSPARSRMPG